MLGQAFDDVLMAARAGAGWAFTRLFDDLAGVVTGYLRQQGAQEPDDLVSETFLDVFRGLDRFEGDEEGFRSWVFTIAHRRLLDERRRLSRQPTTTALDERVKHPATGSEATERPVLDEVDTEQLTRRLDVLTPAQRDVVLLRVVAGLPVAEVAEVVERNPAAVRQLQRRGLQRLAEALQEESEG